MAKAGDAPQLYKQSMDEFLKMAKYPLIKLCDMTSEMREEAVDVCITAVEKFPLEREKCTQLIKDTMDKKFGPAWQVVVGKGFSYDVQYEILNACFFVTIPQWSRCAQRIDISPSLIITFSYADYFNIIDILSKSQEFVISFCWGNDRCPALEGLKGICTCVHCGPCGRNIRYRHLVAALEDTKHNTMHVYVLAHLPGADITRY